MIAQNKDDLIKMMLMPEMGFYLGGSRRMAELYPDKIKVHDNTDYDFYCGGINAENKIKFLTSNGFERVKAEDKTYWDSLLVDIYINRKYRIDCLIRSNVDTYKKAFDSIDPDDYALRLWKSNPEHPVKNMAAFRAGVMAWFNCLFSQYSTSPF